MCRPRSMQRIRVGGACGPPPPVAAPLAGSLRAPSRGDPPLNVCGLGGSAYGTRGLAATRGGYLAVSARNAGRAGSAAEARGRDLAVQRRRASRTLAVKRLRAVERMP